MYVYNVYPCVRLHSTCFLISHSIVTAFAESIENSRNTSRLLKTLFYKKMKINRVEIANVHVPERFLSKFT